MFKIQISTQTDNHKKSKDVAIDKSTFLEKCV